MLEPCLDQAFLKEPLKAFLAWLSTFHPVAGDKGEAGLLTISLSEPTRCPGLADAQ